MIFILIIYFCLCITKRYQSQVNYKQTLWVLHRVPLWLYL